jgi:hypothetical protein
MPTKICVMLDGGYVRALCKQSNKSPKDPQYIEKIAKACQGQDEVIHRIMFYDSGGFTGTAKQPVSGQTKQFTANDKWLHDLSYKDPERTVFWQGSRGSHSPTQISIRILNRTAWTCGSASTSPTCPRTAPSNESFWRRTTPIASPP